MEATRPARLACGFEATPGGGAFYGKTYSFDALSLTARSSFDSFDAYSARSMLFASSASNDCECTNALAHNWRAYRLFRLKISLVRRQFVHSCVHSWGRGGVGGTANGPKVCHRPGLHAKKSLDLDSRNLAQPARLREGRNALKTKLIMTARSTLLYATLAQYAACTLE